MMKMYTQYDFVFHLNLQFWQVFDNLDSSEYVIEFLLCLDLFRWKIWKEDVSMWNKAIIVAFLSTKPNASKYSPF